MTLQEFFARLGEIVAYLGSASVVLLGLSSWIGKILSNRIVESAKSELQKEVESHKASLRKSEFLFQKQYEAASEFIAMKQGFVPKYGFPDMDWHDACAEMARDFDKIAAALNQFIVKHGAVMDMETAEAITRCRGIAEESRFGVTRDEVSDDAVKAAGDMWDRLDKVENTLRNTVWKQSTT